MELPELYQAAVLAHDAARPYCIAQLQYNPETGEQKLVLWRRYPTHAAAMTEPELKDRRTIGLYVLPVADFAKEEAELNQPPCYEPDEDEAEG